MNTAEIIVFLIELYAAAGVAVALAFATMGIGRVLVDAGHVTIGARLLILPAATGLWPYILVRWIRAGRVP